MRVTILAVTGKQPAWVVDAIEDYAKRLRGRVKLELIDLKMESRSGGRPVEALMKSESERLAAQLPAGVRWIALDERGTAHTTKALAQEMSVWKQTGAHVAFVIGGADGLDADFKKRAHAQWALSKLTLPHALAKVLLIEQLYRASSLLEGHPYHRE